jgi:hypothetical protein
MIIKDGEYADTPTPTGPMRLHPVPPGGSWALSRHSLHARRRAFGAFLETHQHSGLSTEGLAVELDRLLAASVKGQVRLE